MRPDDAPPPAPPLPDEAEDAAPSLASDGGWRPGARWAREEASPAPKAMREDGPFGLAGREEARAALQARIEARRAEVQATSRHEAPPRRRLTLAEEEAAKLAKREDRHKQPLTPEARRARAQAAHQARAGGRDVAHLDATAAAQAHEGQRYRDAGLCLLDRPAAGKAFTAASVLAFPNPPRHGEDGRSALAEKIAAMPAHQRPAMRELGRSSHAAAVPFRAMRSDEGGALVPAPPSASPAHQAAYAAAPLPERCEPRMRGPGRRFTHAGPKNPEAVPFSTAPDADLSAELAALSAPGDDPDAPLVLAHQAGQRQLIVAACPRAQAVGLHPGMAVTQARAFVPGLVVEPHDAAADAALLQRLAVHAALRWSPWVQVDGDGMTIDLSGVAHLFGGEARMARRIVRRLAKAGFTARLAIAGTPGAAHALARHGHADIAIVTNGDEAQALSPLPLAALRWEAGALDAARRFGFASVGDLLPLPRAPLAKRLGLAAIRRLDEALGRAAEPLLPVAAPDPIRVERRLVEPIGTPEAIDQVAGDLVIDLIAELQRRGLGVRALALDYERVDGGRQRIAFGTARATREGAHLLRLIHLRRERIDPGFGIERMALHVLRAEPLGATSIGAVLAGEAAPVDVAALVDRLAARVGPQALFRLAPVESDVPERGVARVSPLAEPADFARWRRPARLLRRPEPLDQVIALLPDAPPRRFTWRGEAHEVVAGDGPERIHGEWWRSERETWAVRDYYIVEDSRGARFWLFRRGDGVGAETGDMSWHIHGLFG